MDRERNDRLRDEARRITKDSFAGRSEFIFAGLGSYNDAVAARRARGLNDVTVEVSEHVLADLGVAQQIGLDDGRMGFSAR